MRICEQTLADKMCVCVCLWLCIGVCLCMCVYSYVFGVQTKGIFENSPPNWLGFEDVLLWMESWVHPHRFMIILFPSSSLSHSFPVCMTVSTSPLKSLSCPEIWMSHRDWKRRRKNGLQHSSVTSHFICFSTFAFPGKMLISSLPNHTHTLTVTLYSPWLILPYHLSQMDKKYHVKEDWTESHTFNFQKTKKKLNWWVTLTHCGTQSWLWLKAYRLVWH